jgi:hypothetical protein
MAWNSVVIVGKAVPIMVVSNATRKVPRYNEPMTMKSFLDVDAGRG